MHEFGTFAIVHVTCVGEQIGKMRLVGADQSVKKALIRFHRFLAEYIQQFVGSVEHGWLRVDALSLLIAQVSRLIESRDESVHSPHRLDQLSVNSRQGLYVCGWLLCWHQFTNVGMRDIPRLYLTDKL